MLTSLLLWVGVALRASILLADVEGEVDLRGALKRHKENLKFTIRRQRRIVGLVGVALPVVLPLATCLAGGWEGLPEPRSDGVFPGSSVSIYAYSPAAAWFVGLLSALGIVLLSYRGEHLVDDVLGVVAGVGAIGVALVRTPLDLDEYVPLTLHFGSAITFFAAVAIMTLALFPRDGPLPDSFREAAVQVLRDAARGLAPQGVARGAAKKASRGRRIRTRVYLWMGRLIVIGLGGCGGLIAAKWNPKLPGPTSLFYAAEALCVFAFGAAWLVKAYRLFGDPERHACSSSADEVCVSRGTSCTRNVERSLGGLAPCRTTSTSCQAPPTRVDNAEPAHGTYGFSCW